MSCDGELLLFTVDVMTQELGRYAYNEEDEAHPFKSELEQTIEQCYYCLYLHPNKKTKAKHLQDHGVTQVGFSKDYCKCRKCGTVHVDLILGARTSFTK